MTTVRRPTIRDVARLAGVSHQTVSRRLRGDPTVSPMLAAHIDNAVAQLDYRPNLVARAMRSRSTGRLAMVLPVGDATSSLQLLSGAYEAAQAAGFAVEVVSLPATELHGRRVVELADSGLYEAVLALTDLPPQHRRSTDGAPIVSAPVYDERMRGIGPLSEASRMAELVTHLAEHGHRELLHLTGETDHPASVRRREAFERAVRELDLRSAGVVDCRWDPAIAASAVRDLPRDTGVTAVLAGNDTLAAGAVRGAAERGWSVPGDLSVTGWDTQPLSAAMLPALTSVAIDHRRLGADLLTELLRVMGGDAPEMDRPSITQIVWRESTGPARDR